MAIQDIYDSITGVKKRIDEAVKNNDRIALYNLNGDLLTLYTLLYKAVGEIIKDRGTA